MEDVEKQFLGRLPQTISPEHLNHQEVKAYEAFVRAIAIGRPFGFVLSGKMTTGDIVDAIGFAVVNGDSVTILGAAQWLVLKDQEKVRLKERLELLYPDTFAEVAQRNRFAGFAPQPGTDPLR